MTKLLLLLVAVVDMAIGLWVDGVAVTGGGVRGELGGLEGCGPGWLKWTPEVEVTEMPRLPLCWGTAKFLFLVEEGLAGSCDMQQQRAHTKVWDDHRMWDRCSS